MKFSHKTSAVKKLILPAFFAVFVLLAACTPKDPESGEPYKYSLDGITVKNKTDMSINATALLNAPLTLAFTPNAPSVLIIHTHTSEAYTQTDANAYTPSDPYRTQEQDKNIVAVGNVVADILRANGISVIHDAGVYDYPEYNGSYTRSYTVVESYIEQFPSIICVLDIHRDAAENSDGSQYRTKAVINGVEMAQVSIVVGSNAQDTHDNWRGNLTFALRLAYQINADAPELLRPVSVATYRYNQNLAPAALIIEVGSAGNTLEEALDAAAVFADSFVNLVKELNSENLPYSDILSNEN